LEQRSSAADAGVDADDADAEGCAGVVVALRAVAPHTLHLP
jgi:hypothetical protein